MINLLRRVRKEHLQEGNYRIYAIYAMGEVILVMMGILLALQVDNWNHKRIQNQVEIDNIENLFFSINEDIQLGSLQDMVEYAIQGEQLWIDYLEGTTSYHDSLLYYGYILGATGFLRPNTAFYESLKLKGLETVENKSLRMLLSIIYEQSFPAIQEAMDHFYDAYGAERKGFFREYFVLGEDRMNQYGENFLHTDFVMFRIASLKNKEAMRTDPAFLEFIKMSKMLHQNVLSQLERTTIDLQKAQNLVSHEYNYARFGTPKRKTVTISLEGYQDVEEVFVSGEFNNWRPDGTMIRTPSGWERNYDLFPGSYEYKFIIFRSDQIRDPGNWMMDPANPDSTFVPSVGVWNSVLTVRE